MQVSLYAPVTGLHERRARWAACQRPVIAGAGLGIGVTF